jgi:hypothetical protein
LSVADDSHVEVCVTDELSKQRIEALENAVRRLVSEVGEIRRELAGARGNTGTARPVASVVERPTPAADTTAPLSTDIAGTPIEPSGLARTAATTGSPTPNPVPEPLWRRVLDPPDKVARRATAKPLAPAPPRSKSRGIPAGMSFEDLVGRYGAMALAALAILSAVGIFLSWAIAQNLIGPEVRVGAGFAAAAALGALGWRLRTRGARTFGNTLMGIALAVVHVDAWGAGPGLGVIPGWIALAIAALASVALAVLAWRTMEQSLFVVGVGGALIAPFVTTPSRGNGEALLIFGWLVLTVALYGMRDRQWNVARWLLGTACITYAGAAMTAAWSVSGTLGREMPVIFALACAWSALALGGPLHSPSLTRAYLAAALPPLFYDWDTAGVFPLHLALTAAGTLTLLATVYRREEEGAGWLTSTVVIPLGFLAAALLPLDDTTSTQGALVALGWAAGAGVVGAMVDDVRRQALWMVAALASGLAIVLAVSENDLYLATGLAAHAAVVAAVMRRERAGLLMGSALLSIAVATYAAGLLYTDRPPYSYTPFLTRASLAGLLVVLGWAALGWNVSRTELPNPLPPRERSLVASLGIIAAFVWGHVELASAFSPDISTFLLIVYYATCGVVAIFVGRRDGLADLRRVGLALAIFAALKAVAQAYELDQVGLRVGSFLLVGGFLLAVAYWYRAAGESNGAAADGGVQE